MNTEYLSHIEASVDFIKARTSMRPTTAVILGSGLGEFGDQLIDRVAIKTADVPYYPVSSVIGHAGKLLFGKIKAGGVTSNDLMVFQGRIHFYESNDSDIVVYPVEVARRLGIRTLIVTNAAGGINPSYSPGDLMFIRDYLNATFENPLTSRATAGENLRRPAFSERLLKLAKSIAEKNNIPFKEGVYCWTKGPSYESAAEIQMMARMGADAVGMSTVPEVIVAAHYGMEVLGISCVTNLATGLGTEKLNHAEVTEVANKVKHNFTSLISQIILALG